MSAPIPRAGRANDEPPDPCAIPECRAPSVRSLARVEARRAFPDLSEEGRRAPLCREHYKEWKKATRTARKLDRIAWG